MPKSSLLNVPYSGLPTVESRDRPQAWQNIKVNEDMFGAGQGKALQQLGQTIGQVGAQIGAQMEKNQAEDDGTRARAIDTEVMKEYTKATAEYSLLNGEQAVNGYADHEKRLADIRDNAVKSAGGNKSVERMVRSSVEGQYRRAWSTAFSVKTKGHIEHGDQVSTARIDAAQQRAQVTMDEKELESSINIIAGETNEKARRNNWSREVTELETKNKSSTAYTGFIGNMARHYPAQAQLYFDKYKDKLNPEGIKATEKAIADGFAGAGAQEQRENIRKGLPPELPKRRDITPPKPPAAVEPPGRPGGQRSEVEPQTRGIQLASLTTGTMSDAPPPGAQRLAEVQGFDPSGEGYDDARAKEAGMERDETGHMGSVAPTTDKEKKEFNLPDESYIMLKGEKHETWDKAVQGEQERGFEVVKIGDRYYSVPKEAADSVKQPRPGSEKISDIKVADTTGRLPRLAPPTPSDAKIMPGYVVSYGEMRDYVVQQARRRGVDPGTALRVVDTEGGYTWKSSVPGENSFGPFQLYTGGGLGNKFIEAGHGDPSDPRKWRENVEFALNNVVEGGWGPWNGAKAVGIVGKMGVANNARVIPVGDSIEKQVSSHPLVPGLDEDGDEPAPTTPLQERTFTGLKKVISEGDTKAVAAPGSNVIHAYNIPGRIRALPPAPELESAMDKAAKTAGVVVRITSGGQTTDRNPAMKDRPGGWTGSLRHNGGNAGDIDILDADGKTKLSRDDPKRLAFLREVAANGAGGIGTGYMSDPLKVHVGLTGGSGQVGVGLGVYSKESTKEEVAAIRTGLATLEANGGPVQGPSVAGGNVRYASYSPTGTMSDAPQPGFNPPSATQRYAQATATDAVNPFNGPLTAETTEANIRARMKWIEDDARAKGHEPSYARSLNADMQAEWETLKRAKVETHALAFKSVEEAVYGKNGDGKTRTKDEILQDPVMRTQWNLLTAKEKDQMEKQLIARNSEGENRPVTPADLQRLDALRASASSNPEVLKNVDLSEWPKGLRAQVMKLRNDLYTNGVGGNAETKELNSVMEDKSVAYQLERAGLTKDIEPGVYGEIKSKMAGEIRLWKERNPDKPLSSEEAAKLMNRLLRTELAPKTGSVWERVFGQSEQRGFERKLTTEQEKAIVNDWNRRFPDNPVKTHEDIPTSNRWYWQRKKEEAERRRLQGGQ